MIPIVEIQTSQSSFVCDGLHQRVKGQRIIMDGGSTVNIIPKSKMNDLGITIEELSRVER